MKLISRQGMLKTMVDAYCELEKAIRRIEELGFEYDGNGHIGKADVSLYDAIALLYVEKLGMTDTAEVEDWLADNLLDVLQSKSTNEEKANLIWEGKMLVDNCEICGWDCAINENDRKCNKDKG